MVQIVILLWMILQNIHVSDLLPFLIVVVEDVVWCFSGDLRSGLLAIEDFVVFSSCGGGGGSGTDESSCNYLNDIDKL